jgi:hypothetical protein
LDNDSGPDALLIDSSDRLFLAHLNDKSHEDDIYDSSALTPVSVIEALRWYARFSPDSMHGSGEISDLCRLAAEQLTRMKSVTVLLEPADYAFAETRARELNRPIGNYLEGLIERDVNKTVPAVR